ncbi:MAG: hypothetical protein QOC81_4033 [Thermoanaerobaculia bacterium]|jgi:hypothetical protein|nr:hypothetical protein [Thermoanaerobaculia bacterium]
MSKKSSATAPTPDNAEPISPVNVGISFGYATGFSANPQTLVLHWPTDPSPITISFQLESIPPGKFSFYDRGIVFQYPHDEFTILSQAADTVSFTATPPDLPTDEVSVFRYAVLIRDNDTNRVCFFDPTVQNDPPGM